MLIPLEWFYGCALLLTFECAIFANTNSVEIENSLPQSLDRFRALVYGSFFMVNWMDSIIERICFSGMVRRECIRFIYILLPTR